MALFRNTAEGGTNGTTVTTGNSGAGSGDAFTTVTLGTGGALTFDNSTAMHGGLSYNVTPGAGSNDIVQWTTATSTSGAFRFYVRLTGNPTAATQLARFATSGSVVVANVAINTTGVLIVQGPSATLYTGTAALSLNTWYRIELACTVGTSTTGVVNFAAYVGDSMTLFDSFSSSAANLGTTAFAKFTLGKVSNSGNWSQLNLDDIAVDDANAALLGPTSGPFPLQGSRRVRFPFRRRVQTVQPVPAVSAAVAHPVPAQPGRHARTAQPRPGRTAFTVTVWPIVYGVPTSPSLASSVSLASSGGVNPPPATTQALPPQPGRGRLLLPPRHPRTATWTHVTVQVAIPAQPARKRAAASILRRRGFTTQPVPAPVVVTTQALPPQQTRPRLPLPRLRHAFTTQPVPAAQVVVTAQALPVQPSRSRVVLPRLRRATSTQPVPVQVQVTAHPIPPQPVRDRIAPPMFRRRSTIQPIPGAVVVVTAQALPPQPVRDRLTPPMTRRGHESHVLPAQVVIVPAWPVQPRRAPSRLMWPGRRRRGANVSPTQTAVVVPITQVTVRLVDSQPVTVALKTSRNVNVATTNGQLVTVALVEVGTGGVALASSITLASSPGLASGGGGASVTVTTKSSRNINITTTEG